MIIENSHAWMQGLKKPKLAILIPTIDGREDFFKAIMDELQRQRAIEKNIKTWYDVAIIVCKDEGWRKGGKSIGEKRNILTKLAIESGATHRAFLDDDDMISEDYLELNMPGVYGNYDCNSLVGIITHNGYKNPDKHIFLHSLKYDHWYEDEKYYYRNPNHLNVCSLAKVGHVRFVESNFGEDGKWSEEVHRQGLLKTEYVITEPFYYYKERTKIDGI